MLRSMVTMWNTKWGLGDGCQNKVALWTSASIIYICEIMARHRCGVGSCRHLCRLPTENFAHFRTNFARSLLVNITCGEIVIGPTFQSYSMDRLQRDTLGIQTYLDAVFSIMKFCHTGLAHLRREGGRLLAQETVGDQNMATAFFQLARDTDIYM